MQRRTFLQACGAAALVTASGPSSMLALGQAGTPPTTATSADSYDYPKKYLWDVKRVWNKDSQPISLRDRTARTSGGRVDLNKFINSPFGEQTVIAMENYILYTDEMDPRLLAYYEGIGLKKELNEPGEYYTRWSCYTPLSLHKANSKGRKYPFLFINHGASMPMQWEECSGFLPLCGKHEVIAVAAQNHNPENLMRILAIVKQKYPVDESRIYCQGYSQGGFQTSDVTFKHPDVFAGAFPGGNAVFYPKTLISDAEVENFRHIDMPIVLVNGQQEGQFPLYEAAPPRTPAPNAYANSPDPTLQRMTTALNDPTQPTDPIDRVVDLLNRRLKASRCRAVSKEEVLASKNSSDEVVRAHGIPYDHTEVREIYGVKHFIGDFKNNDGRALLRFISVDNHPHWPPCTMPALQWEFMSNYRRDPRTKKLIAI